MKYVVVFELQQDYRFDKRKEFGLAGAGGGWSVCEEKDLGRGIKKINGGTRSSCRAKARRYIRFPCRVVLEIDEFGNRKIIDRFGRGSNWFRKPLGLPEIKSDASE